MWSSTICVALGVWLMAAPAVLGYGGAAATSDRIAGPVIASIAFVAASRIARALRWVNLLPAAWLVVAPWVLAFEQAAVVNSVLVGVLVAGLVPLGRSDPSRYGGGWRALLHPRDLAGAENRAAARSA